MSPTEETPQNEVLGIDYAKKKNQETAETLHKTLKENEKGIQKLRNKLTYSYWFIIFLSICSFAIGILLLSVPIMSAYSGNMDEFQAVIAGGFGIVDLFGLVLFGPIEKIHKLMGDMSQLILTLNCNQMQIGLRLMEMDGVNDRKSIGTTAEYICKSTENHVKLIEKYFETPEKKAISTKKTGSNSDGVALEQVASKTPGASKIPDASKNAETADVP